MSQTITMTQYGLTETVEKSAEQFAGLTVSRVLSQERGVYRLVSAQGEKWGEVSGRFQYGIQLKSEFVPELDFVIELDGKLIGQNMFMRAIIKADDGRTIPIMTMGPICITPDLKRKGYGKRLLDYSLEKAKELGCGAVCFEGNIDFYGKSGFTQASHFGIRYHGVPEGEDASFFLCKELIPGYLDGITGEYATPQGYFVDEAAVEAFDKAFPAKEKKKLPGQLF